MSSIPASSLPSRRSVNVAAAYSAPGNPNAKAPTVDLSLNPQPAATDSVDWSFERSSGAGTSADTERVARVRAALLDGSYERDLDAKLDVAAERLLKDLGR